eukprot:3927124-Amphidinium_carterae.1
MSVCKWQLPRFMGAALAWKVCNPWHTRNCTSPEIIQKRCPSQHTIYNSRLPTHFMRRGVSTSYTGILSVSSTKDV